MQHHTQYGYIFSISYSLGSILQHTMRNTLSRRARFRNESSTRWITRAILVRYRQHFHKQEVWRQSGTLHIHTRDNHHN